MIKLTANRVQTIQSIKSSAQDLKWHIDEKISSLEILLNISDGKCRTNMNYQKNEILNENV